MSALVTLGNTVWSIWNIVLAAAVVGRFIWLMKPTKQRERAWRILGRVHRELWLIALPGLVATMHRHLQSDFQWYLLIFDAFGLYNWWFYRNWPDDDNHWKRRAKKAKDAVAVRAGRLVVVPAGGPS